MEALKAGHFWKTPFFWTPGSERSVPPTDLVFHPADPDWLVGAVAEVMATSLDESDVAAVAELGSMGAARELLDVPADYFEVHPSWWLEARAASGERIGFVLIARLRPERYWQGDKTQGTIYYMGILPAHRGAGHAAGLLAAAQATCTEAGCWRVFCDTSSRNGPMLQAFRRAGFEERAPWQRPVR